MNVLTRTRCLVFLPVVVAAMSTGCARRAPDRTAPFNHHYTHWGMILARCVTPDGFRYDQLAADPQPLALQIAELQGVTMRDFAGFNRDERLSYLINAHNIFAIRRVLREYPVKSIEATSVFVSALNRRDIRLLEKEWSLQELRDEILGAEYSDSRAVFVLNWCMKGCAPLAPSPATPDNVREMLEHRTTLFVRDPRYCKYDVYDRRMDASPLLKDYRELIERDYTTLWGFVRHFASPRDLASMEAAPPRFEWTHFDTLLNNADVLPAVPAPPE